MKHEVSRQIFLKILKYQISWKFVQLELSFSIRMDGRTDGRTDMMKLINGCDNSEDAPKKCRKNSFLNLESMKTIKQIEVLEG